MKALHFHRPPDAVSARVKRALSIKETTYAQPVAGAAPPRTVVEPNMREPTADLRWPDTRPGADAVIPSRGKI